MTTLPQQVAKHFREVHEGGNWTTSNLRELLADITLDEALTQVYDLNTIAALLYHIHYYVRAVLRVLQGGPLEASDRLSFDAPPLADEAAWAQMKAQALTDAEAFAARAAQLPEEQLWAPFTDEKYGSYYRNIHGIIEHTHYHLGQIALLKKIIRHQRPQP